ncbi:hydroxymethylbilane synthase [Spirosomataceae bacterium TFI 002]|nr:hydroxymethylbilane synthase [Spirosomataceae bacterium TFI 002]
MNITIGTRGSKLALWQAYYIEELLQKAGATTEIKTIETKGDKILDRALSKIGSKGVFTEELEEQLTSGEIDIAVHSAKDLQSDLGDNFEILAFTEREKINDVLVSRIQDFELKEDSTFTIGTSSTRRVALLSKFYPKLKIVDMRGNLQTRIKKMDDGACDALLLAFAGVHRMQNDNMIVHEFDASTFTPAVGQGSVAIECSVNLGTEKKALIAKACNEAQTANCLIAERAFLKKVNGGCSIPVFGNATIENDIITLNAGIISLDGSELVRIKESGKDAVLLGQKVGDALLTQGGKEILDEIRKTQSHG